MGVCVPGDATGATLGDDNATLILDMKGDEDYLGLSYDQIQCVLRQLDVSDAVLAEMGGTRALDGRQQGSWGTIEASWSYHPDDGLELVLTDTSAS